MAISFSSTFAKNIMDGEMRAAVSETVQALAEACKQISHICARGPLEHGLGAETGAANTDGDAQKALDVRSDEIITAALETAPVAYYASEEQDDIVTLDASKPLAVASDPLDGSSNIDTNVSIGTIFSIFEAKDDARSSFLRLGSEQICGGFFVYGPQTSLVITTGAGTQTYVLDPDSGVFSLAIADMKIVPASTEYAINASNHHHWDKPIRAYIEDCLLGASGPLGEKYNMRWVGSLVADANRILSRGGIFMYPGDSRDGYAHGRLRLLYEAAPVAFVIEQAGGKATDGTGRILDISLDTLHQRVPLVFGSKTPVQMVGDYHNKKQDIL
ncbi:MAG: class 1 fructose-bisphosphatase [Robiginitomaculum sp.]|nr:MAG: class 1 fructose-bisphosphatase [Robiginitomaculum sp.]